MLESIPVKAKTKLKSMGLSNHSPKFRRFRQTNSVEISLLVQSRPSLPDGNRVHRTAVRGVKHPALPPRRRLPLYGGNRAHHGEHLRRDIRAHPAADAAGRVHRNLHGNYPPVNHFPSIIEDSDRPCKSCRLRGTFSRKPRPIPWMQSESLVNFCRRCDIYFIPVLCYSGNRSLKNDGRIGGNL